MVAAVEADGWSNGRRRLGLAAAGEARAIAAARLGLPAPQPAVPSPLRAWMNERLFALAAPFDTHAFQRRHFTKVAPQTLQMLDAWIAEGEARGLATARLAELRQALVNARANAAALAA